MSLKTGAAPFLARWVRSLQFKLIAIPLGVLILTFSLLTLFGLSTLRSALEASQMKEQQRNVEFLAYELDSKLRARLDELSSAGAQLDLERLADKNYLQQFLKDRYPFEKDFSAGMLILAADGQALADYPAAKGRRGDYFRDRDYYQRAIRTRGPVVSKPFTARPMNRPAIALSVPIFDAQGKIRVIMVGAIDLSTPEFLGVATDGSRLGNTERYVVSLDDGVFIASSDKARLLAPIPSAAQSPVMAKMQAGFQGTVISLGAQRIEKIFAITKVARTGWVVIEAVSTESAFRPVAKLRSTLYAGAIVALIALLGTTLLLTRRALRPLVDASAQMEAMSRGQQALSALPEEGDTEVRELLSSFNRLTHELIAHRRHLEELVARRTAEVSELYNLAPCGYHSLNAQGVFTHINDTELGWLGYAREELVDKLKATDLLTPASQRIFQQNFPRMSREGKVSGLELEFVRRDGSILPVTVDANAVFDEHGGLLQTRSILTDNSERLRTSRALIAARDAAESADRAKSAFLANMSHEIRTPMNAVLGLAYLLEKMQLPGDASDLVAKIGNAGRLLLSIINDILDLSKVESGKLEIEASGFRLSQVLANVASVMAINVADKELELIITPSNEDVDHVRGDALRLEQVLINLTNNAIKFTDRGYVNIQIDKLESNARQVTLRFAVRDTGIGISDDMRAQLFKPFTQGDASTTRRFGGSGLGLTISQRLVALMGGEIGVTSKLGSGSEFWFVLTFERDTPQLSAPELDGIDVLIADDSAVATEALRITAGNLGWHAETVDSGRAALEHVIERHSRDRRHDVILLDWKMPDMDGLATARAIHDFCKGDHEPIVLMVTAYSRKDLLDDPDAALLDGVLTKPVTASTLYDAVSAALQARQGGHLPIPLEPAGVARLAHVRILLVDDSDINLEVAQRIFGGEGATVTLANDGREALDWLEAHPDEVDIVLMDVQMPVMDGYEATRLIRQNPRLAHLPVVALTAGAFKAQQDAAHAAGMNDYLAKPFQVDAAVSLIRRLTGRTGVTADAAPVSTAGDLPGLALGRGMATWRDAAVYRQYLRKFMRDYADCVPALTAADRASALALAHKLVGSAATLALHQVAEAAGALEQALHKDEAADAASHVALQAALQAALDTAQASIAQFAPDDADDAASDAPTGAAIDRARVLQLLGEVLDAYDSDDPLSITPFLLELETLLPRAQVAPLRNAVENFDFRGGEAATRALAELLELPLRG